MTNPLEVSRRDALKSWMAAVTAAGAALPANMFAPGSTLWAAEGDAPAKDPVRCLPAGEIPKDRRLVEKLKDYDSYFPFTPYGTKEEWTERAGVCASAVARGDGPVADAGTRGA